MYEYFAGNGLGGLGWSEIEGYPSCTDITGGGIRRCFTERDADIQCANSCGCRRLQQGCTVTGGGAGFQWCCPRQCPDLSKPAGQTCTPPRNKICDLTRVAQNSLTNSRQRAIWAVKDKLCRQGFDPGPVNGEMNALFSEAISAFQSRNGLPQSGNVDAPTLRLLGFTSAQSQEYANLIATEESIVPAIQLPWALIGVSSVASLFMMYAAWKFIKTRKK